jgi:hypothetical protein
MYNNSKVIASLLCVWCFLAARAELGGSVSSVPDPPSVAPNTTIGDTLCAPNELLSWANENDDNDVTSVAFEVNIKENSAHVGVQSKTKGLIKYDVRCRDQCADIGLCLLKTWFHSSSITGRPHNRVRRLDNASFAIDAVATTMEGIAKDRFYRSIAVEVQDGQLIIITALTNGTKVIVAVDCKGDCSSERNTLHDSIIAGGGPFGVPTLKVHYERWEH